jgi:transposase InsO family protein
VALAQADGANVRQLCRTFGIGPATAYKWLHRFEQAGPAGLADRSRRPHASPWQTAPAVEAAVLALRAEHPAWGGRKLAARLVQAEILAADQVPAPSTITAILRRHARLTPPPLPRVAPHRFERSTPNQLWQMDFKGPVPLAAGQGRLHPLTVLDDHSRYCVGLTACANERTATVQAALITSFQQYGVPDRLLMDNGAPWGTGGAAHPWTPLTVWLVRLGIAISHGRPYHPQTQGKDERFHRTLKAEVLQGPPYASLAAAQRALAAWRTVYNLERPHEACGLQPPSRRYQPSARRYPDLLPPLVYAPDLLVRRVQQPGEIWLHGQAYTVPDAFVGQELGLRALARDGHWQVSFGRYPVTTLIERARSAPR